jgi:hypothetical protein
MSLEGIQIIIKITRYQVIIMEQGNWALGKQGKGNRANREIGH